MHRRELLRAAAATAALAAVPGCTPRGDRGGGRRALAPVRVAADRVIRTVVGLRPFRHSGFRLEVEQVGERTVVHNYGHGASGFTLSWGTAELAVDLALAAAPRPRIAVLGGGVIGLSTARLLQRRGVAVTIYARELPPHTTSDLAGATYNVGGVVTPERRTAGFERLLDRAMRISHRRFQELVGERYGVKWIERYAIDDRLEDWPDRDRIAELFPAARWLDRGESPFGAGASCEVTMHIEPPIYLRAVIEDFLVAGGRFVVRELADRAELATLPEETVMNCTGLGAGRLFADPEVEPVRGQLSFLLPQPEVDYAIGKGELYMMPRRDGILLGGTFQRGDWSLAPDPATATRILTGHAVLFATMRHHPIRRPLG
jgi:D-amino-acid oxidase